MTYMYGEFSATFYPIRITKLFHARRPSHMEGCRLSFHAIRFNEDFTSQIKPCQAAFPDFVTSYSTIKAASLLAK